MSLVQILHRWLIWLRVVHQVVTRHTLGEADKNKVLYVART
jgi:hypothetical protein